MRRTDRSRPSRRWKLRAIRTALRSIYSLLGPALLPLALRYQSDNRKELLTALRTLFREMPANTIPPEVRKSLPELFRM